MRLSGYLHAWFRQTRTPLHTVQRYNSIQYRLRKTEKKCQYLEQNIKESVEKNNIEVDKQLNDGLYEITKEYSNEVWEKQFPLSFLEPAVGKCGKETETTSMPSNAY